VDGDGDPLGARGCDTGIANGRFDSCSGQVAGHRDVTIRDGTVRQFAHGVQVVIADRNSLLRLRLEHNSGFGGIASYLMKDGRIEDNRAFANDNAGIAVYEPAGETTISRNVSGRNPGDGIEVMGAAPGDRFEDNVAFGNRGAGFDIGGARGLLIRGNRSYANPVGMNLWDGVIDNQIVVNRVWGNGVAGISMGEGAHGNRLEHNAVYRNGRSASAPTPYSGGITIAEGRGNRIIGNRVLGNGGQGGIVIADESGGNVIASNDVSGSIAHGISIAPLYEDAGGMTINANKVTRNGLDGIHVSDELHDPDTHIQVSRVRGNRTDRNGDDGIDVRSAMVALAGNRARWNADLGIDAIPAVADGGRNRARWNGNPLQCVNVFCR
jgi:parallel beta-helix repeat protein